jgi:hypothetical protein
MTGGCAASGERNGGGERKALLTMAFIAAHPFGALV